MNPIANMWDDGPGSEEIANNRAEGVHFDEKGIVTADAVEFDEVRIVANLRETRSQLALLFERKQDVGAYTYDERALQVQTLEPGVQ